MLDPIRAVDINYVIDTINNLLRKSQSNEESRHGLLVFTEWLFNEHDKKLEFGYLDIKDVPKGCLPGIRRQAFVEDPFADTDCTRRRYYRQTAYTQVSIGCMVDEVNEYLKESVTSHASRELLSQFIEQILMETANYGGFKYLTADDLAEGILPGIHPGLNMTFTEHFTDTDSSRRKYLVMDFG